ncbi:putative F-box protein [Platanthera zijinensis]|uniref:F-box protein n=1 Tax=Platanthera zijinensis TaxID=2320716 RepID=A0AAP0AT05_9ASPA
MSLMAYSFSSTISSHSWSNLPLDLLISITERLVVRSDRLSFRTVCSDWRSAVPRPKQLPWYSSHRPCVYDENHRNFILEHREIRIPITLHFHSHKTIFFLASNGWLLFITHHRSYYLLDPVSQQQHWLPHITRRKQRVGKHKSNNDSALVTAVVSMSRNGGLAVAGVAQVYNHMGDSIGQRFSYIEINGKEKSWHFSRKSCVNRMIRIIEGGGDEKRFYAVDENWGLYLLEAGPLMRWRRFNLMWPKHNSKMDDLETFHGKKGSNMYYCLGLREANDGSLELMGMLQIGMLTSGPEIPVLKVHPSGLRINTKDANVPCDKEWTDVKPSPYYQQCYFVPRL